MLELKVPPPIVAATAAVLMWALDAGLPQLRFDLPWRLLLVSLFALAALGLAASAVALFRRRGTTIHPLRPEEATALVTDGLYRLSRNPMYLGLAVLLCAWGLYLANTASFLGVPLFVAYMNRFQIAPEEKALQARFGGAYAEYRGRVRRWI